MPVALDFTRPHVLRTEEEYTAALERLEALLVRDPSEGSDEHAELEFLALLVEAYEEEHVPIGAGSTPQSVVEFMLDQKGMQRSDLNAVMGGKARVSEFLSGKRPLSMSQVRALRELLGIPADLLISVEPRGGTGRGGGTTRGRSGRVER